jgi:hypothetical protein
VLRNGFWSVACQSELQSIGQGARNSCMSDLNYALLILSFVLCAAGLTIAYVYLARAQLTPDHSLYSELAV